MLKGGCGGYPMTRGQEFGLISLKWRPSLGQFVVILSSSLI